MKIIKNLQTKLKFFWANLIKNKYAKTKIKKEKISSNKKFWLSKNNKDLIFWKKSNKKAMKLFIKRKILNSIFFFKNKLWIR